jgi:hypothetical protein
MFDVRSGNIFFSISRAACAEKPLSGVLTPFHCMPACVRMEREHERVSLGLTAFIGSEALQHGAIVRFASIKYLMRSGYNRGFLLFLCAACLSFL